MKSDLKGNIGLGKAISYFTEQGYIVSLPLTDHQCYDLIIEKDGNLQMVQVRYTGCIGPYGNFIGRLETKNSEKTFYNIKDTYCDLLFYYCENGDMFLVPIKDIIQKHTINLYRTKSKYTQKDGFDSSKYLINNVARVIPP